MRMTVYLTCNNNNYATTVLQSFIQAINTFSFLFGFAVTMEEKISRLQSLCYLRGVLTEVLY